MPNTYTTDENGTYIVDRSGKKYRCNQAYPLPLPDGIAIYSERDAVGQGQAVLFANPDQHWGHKQIGDTHWLARAPLPEVPRPKTQAETDADGFNEWLKQPGSLGFAACWQAACEYARKEQP